MFKSIYAKQAQLLLRCLPEVGKQTCFALKGGTAINFFFRPMPRLSVDIDLAYLPLGGRDKALADISRALEDIATDVRQRVGSTHVQISRAGGMATKLVVALDDAQIKVEPNHVLRGSVYPPEVCDLCPEAQSFFELFVAVPTLSHADLYAGKICAALDRQHPRDLFDVCCLFETGEMTDAMVECFVVYLAGHNRPTHEVLFGNDKDIAGEYERAFVGMTEVDCSLETLLDARARMRRELPQRLSTAHRRFLSGLARAEPDWSLVQCQHAAQLPALRWKLANLETFRKRRPDDFAAQSAALDTGLGQS